MTSKRTGWALVVGLLLVVGLVAGCGGEDTSADGAPGPLELTAVQLGEVPPAAGDVAELMGVDGVDHDMSAPLLLPVELPPSTTVETQQYWSTDAGVQTMGEGPVDWVLVTLVLVEDEADVQALIDEVTSVDEGYVQWVPLSVRGATAAQESVAIPYEGEPTDEPEWSTILARRDRLIVGVTAAGTDDEARPAAAVGVAELMFERAGELSSP